MTASAKLSLYAVLYVRLDGVISVEDSGLCLSTAASRAKECADSLCSEAQWNESEQAWISKIGTRVAVRPISFTWEEVKDGR